MGSFQAEIKGGSEELLAIFKQKLANLIPFYTGYCYTLFYMEGEWAILFPSNK